MGDAQQTGGGGRRAGGRYRLPLMIATAALLAVSMIRNGTAGHPGPPQPAAGEAPAVTGDGTGSGPAPAPLAFSTPTRVLIPVLNVNAPVTTVGPDADDGIGAPPPAFKNLAGWYTGAPSPGQRGTAVIDGHVDNMRGPAVFYGLGTLHKGNEVDVVRSDGSTAVFSVYGIEVFAKNAFPGDRVYGETGRPELRVITCGGGFTKKTGYDSDVVVFARLSAVR